MAQFCLHVLLLTLSSFVLSGVYSAATFTIVNKYADNYCICNHGLSDEIYQMNIDYACQNGADCTPIMENGLCFQPNTVKDHCNIAVNSYYKKNGDCSFANTNTVTQAAPPATECAYPARASPRDIDPPKQQLVFNFSLSIKIILPIGLVVTVTVMVLLKLFQRYRLNEGETQPAGAANNQNMEGKFQIEIPEIGV